MLISSVLLILTTSAYTLAAPSANKFSINTHNDVVLFGNSISDTGNIYNVTGHAIPNDKFYYKGRFSNGPNWVDHLEVKLGISVKNFAFGGATTSNNVVPATTPIANVLIPSIYDQAKLFYTPTIDANSTAVQNTLYIIEIANNNYIYTEGEKQSVNEITIQNSASSIIDTVDYLHSELGARKFLVFGVAALEHTPHFRGLPQKFQEETVRVTTEHNRLLRLDLREYKRKHENVEIFFFDLKGFMESIIKNGAALGFKDVIHACYNEETGAICSNPDDYLFWDHIHPTTKGHALLMKGVLETTIPINDADSSSNGDGNKKGSNAGNKGELY